jgi:uncharacterized damage-inducible protein DinB
MWKFAAGGLIQLYFSGLFCGRVCFFTYKSVHMAEVRKIEKPSGVSQAFFQRYIDLVPADGKLLMHLQDIMDETEELMNSLPAEKLKFRYEPGKWTIPDILVHLMDSERIFGRNDQTPLPGFDQDPFADNARANDRDLSGIMDEFKLLRASSIAFIESFDEAALQRSGIANGHPMSVLTLLNLIYGHHKHHWNIIHEKYL